MNYMLLCIGEGNGNPLQCSRLENPRDEGAWWAASMGLHRIGHDWSNLAVAAAAFKLFAYILTPLIVSDSIYSIFIFKNIETSTINSNQPIIQQLFFELQSAVRNRNSPIYITRIRAHSCLLGPKTHGNEQADKLVSFAIPEEQHALLCNNSGSLHQLWIIPYRQAKEIISNCSTCRPIHLWPMAQGINPHGLQPNELWQMDVKHCPELSPSSFLHVCVDTSSFVWAPPLHGEATQHVITHLLPCLL